MYLYEEKNEELVSENGEFLLEDVLFDSLLESSMENVLLSLGSIGENYDLLKEAVETDSVLVLSEAEMAKVDEEAEDFYDQMRESIKHIKKNDSDTAKLAKATKIAGLVTVGLTLLLAMSSFASSKNTGSNLPAVQGAKGGVGKGPGAAKALKVIEAVVGGLASLSLYVTAAYAGGTIGAKLGSKLALKIYKSQFAKAKVKYAGYPSVVAKIERGEKIITEIEGKSAAKKAAKADAKAAKANAKAE